MHGKTENEIHVKSPKGKCSKLGIIDKHHTQREDTSHNIGEKAMQVTKVHVRGLLVAYVHSAK